MTSFQRGSLILQPALARNRWNQLLTGLAALFTGLAVLPLVVVIAYVLGLSAAFAANSIT